MADKPSKIELWMFFIVLAIAFAGMFYLGPAITGFVIKEFSYSDDINLVVTANGSYTLSLENAGDLKSVKIDGRVTTYGRARVYIESNDAKHLIFDSTKLGKGETANLTNLITGFVAKEDEEKENKTKDKEKKISNKKPFWIGSNEFVVNGTAQINLSQHFSDKDNDKLIYAASEADGLSITLDNGIATITPIKEDSFNTTITFVASDGLESESNTVRLIIIVEKKENKAPVWIGDDAFIVKGVTSINLSKYFIDEDNDELAYSTGLVEGIKISIDKEMVTLVPDGFFNASTIFAAFDGANLAVKDISIVVVAPKEANESAIEKINHVPEFVGIEPLILNKTLTIDLSNYFADEDNDSLSFSVSDAIDIEENIAGPILTLTAIKDNFNATITITASDGNLSAGKDVKLLIPLAPETAGKTITIGLAYKTGTIYDANDNGEESINGVVDLSVEDTSFSWDAAEQNLCTRWEIFNEDEGILTKLCNGAEECCAFIGLLPSYSNWSSIYYSVFGKDNAGYNNAVAAQVIYYDVNASIGIADVVYSEWGRLSTRFFSDEVVFADVCFETCALSGLNKSSYKLVFEVEDGAVLRIDKIKYDVLADVKNNAPLLLQNFSTIKVEKNKNATINLSEYFADPDGDKLRYDHYKADNIAILFDDDIAIILPEKGFEGSGFTYITANDSESYAVSNIFFINVAEPLELKFFEIRSKDDKRLAVFDSSGSLEIKGSLTEDAELASDENDFALYDAAGELIFVVKNPEGNLLLKGSLNENQAELAPTPNSFVIQDISNAAVAYVSSEGSLFLRGSLRENVLFG